MKMYPKESDWRDSFANCKPYIKQFKTALDIGARAGEFAYYLNDFSAVHSFEFRDKRKAYFERCINKKKFMYYQVGISDHNGFEYTTSHKVGRIKGRGDLKVPTRTIDSYNFESVDFIKLDVEGHEYKCIQGAEQTIKKFTPVIIIEQNKDDFSASELLKQWGYKIVHEMHLGNMLHDFIMVKS